MKADFPKIPPTVPHKTVRAVLASLHLASKIREEGLFCLVKGEVAYLDLLFWDMAQLTPCGFRFCQDGHNAPGTHRDVAKNRLTTPQRNLDGPWLAAKMSPPEQCLEYVTYLAHATTWPWYTCDLFQPFALTDEAEEASQIFIVGAGAYHPAPGCWFALVAQTGHSRCRTHVRRPGSHGRHLVPHSSEEHGRYDEKSSGVRVYPLAHRSPHQVRQAALRALHRSRDDERAYRPFTSCVLPLRLSQTGEKYPCGDMYRPPTLNYVGPKPTVFAIVSVAADEG